jgi:hypothetical protein
MVTSRNLETEAPWGELNEMMRCVRVLARHRRSEIVKSLTTPRREARQHYGDTFRVLHYLTTRDDIQVAAARQVPYTRIAEPADGPCRRDPEPHRRTRTNGHPAHGLYSVVIPIRKSLNTPISTNSSLLRNAALSRERFYVQPPPAARHRLIASKAQRPHMPKTELHPTQETSPIRITVPGGP